MSVFSAHILTLFPDLFPGALAEGVTGRGLEQGLWHVETTNIRDFATDNYSSVDDTPYGGGAGMVMKPDIVSSAIDSVENKGRIIYLSPRGKLFNQAMAHEFIEAQNLTILCGRYEGVDQRVLEAYDIEEISIGDYVLSNGELAAQIVLDACVRLIAGVVNNDETTAQESHENGLLEYPHYTRPAEWTDSFGVKRDVPEVLTSGHHAKIAEWRSLQSKEITQKRRPDMWESYENQEK